MGLHDENAAVTQVHFLPHQVRSEHSQHTPSSLQCFSSFVGVDLIVAPVQVELVTLLDDNSLHMWTLRAHKGLSELLEIGRFTLTGPPG